MTEPEDQIGEAVRLMRDALALLDRAGERRAAAHLQHAIDVAERIGPGEPSADAVRRILGG